MNLGKNIPSQIEDEKVLCKFNHGPIFRYESILKIITENLFEPLMAKDDPKAEI